MRNIRIAAELNVVGVAPPAAKKLGPARLTLFFSKYVTAGKISFLFPIERTVSQIAHFPLLHPHKLMAGVYVPVGRNGNIFIAGAASPQAFDGAGPAVQIQHKVKKVYALPCPFHLDDGLSQAVVLVVYPW